MNIPTHLLTAWTDATRAASTADEEAEKATAYASDVWKSAIASVTAAYEAHQTATEMTKKAKAARAESVSAWEALRGSGQERTS
jgi:hypothetical protein